MAARWAEKVAVVVLAVLVVQRVRGAWLRALASALLVLALVNPVLMREEREGLPGIVAVVVDESASQSLGDRTEQTEATLAALKERLAALGDFEVREVRAVDREDGDGTELFSELTGLVDDVPPERMAGAIMITDGIVADIPESAEALGFDGAAARADHRHGGRARPPRRARPRAALRHPERAAVDRVSRARPEPRTGDGRDRAAPH